MKNTLLASLILATLSSAAMAASPNYDKIEFGYTSATTDIDDFDFDTHAYNLAASISVSDNFFLQGGYESDRDDEGGGDVEARTYNLGVGFRAALIDNVDFNATLDYLHTRVDVDAPFLGLDGSDSDSGAVLGVGLRAQVTEPLELAAMIKRAKYEGGGEALDSFHATANYNLTTNFGLYAGYARSLESSDVDAWTLGARVSF